MFWRKWNLITTVVEGIKDTISLCILALNFFLLASFLSYSPHDPSWNVCVQGEPDNLMGSWGACIADMFFQWFGYGAWVWIVVGFGLFCSIALRVPALIWLQVGLAASISVSFVSAFLSKRLEQDWVFCPKGIGAWMKEGRVSLLVTLPFVLYGIWKLGQIALQQAWITQWFSKRKADGQETHYAQNVYTSSASIQDDPAERTDAFNVSSSVPKTSTQIPNTQNTSITAQAAKSSGLKARVRLHDPQTILPPLEFLTQNPHRKLFGQNGGQEEIARLQTVLEEFGVKGVVLHARPGPVVTLYDLEPAAGVKSARIISLSDDIARSMSALSARIALIPGKNLIGIELSNPHRQMVFLHDLLNTPAYSDFDGPLCLALGQDIAGQPVMVDLARMPHLLVAGTTGSGKSVGVNSMILSLLFRLSPKQCKLLLIDPKMLELAIYDGIPHLLSPVITDPKRAISALKWAVQEMEARYRKMSQLGVRNIMGYNQKVQEAKKENQPLSREVQLGFDEKNRPCFQQQVLDSETLPYIVIVVDEMADLMLLAGKELEVLIQRLAQMARAAGIHLIMATQRPSVDVITGTIKANFPTRISFQVTSKIDSRTILGDQGAESLLGQGDMLYMASGGRVMRVHGPFVSDTEIEKVVTFLKSQGEPEYIDMAVHEEEDLFSSPVPTSGQDTMYQQAVTIVMRDRKVSTSYIQRQLQIGYNRAARIVEQMEKEGLISAPNHTGKREILVS